MTGYTYRDEKRHHTESTRPAVDDENWLIHSVQENVMRRQLDREEQTRTAQALLDLGCSRAGVAEAFGVSVASIGKWLNPEPPKAKPKYGHRLQSTTVRTWVAAWRAELNVRDVTAIELLDQLARVAEAGAIRGTLPADLAAATAERVA